MATGWPSLASEIWNRDSTSLTPVNTVYVHLNGSSPSLQVNLVLNEGKSLGLMIRGGAEYSLGIYITGVDKGSEAESTGLKVRMMLGIQMMLGTPKDLVVH